MTQKTYSARSAALRAMKAAHLDPKYHEVFKSADGRFSYRTIGAPAPAATKTFEPQNPTRKAELAKAREDKKLGTKVKKFTEAFVGKRAQAIADAQAGKLPAPPDFSAETHTRFRPRLAELVALVKAKDIKALKAFEIKAISTSPKAMDRYRNLAVMALEAQAAKSKAAA